MLPFFSALIALSALAGGVLGFNNMRAEQEQAVRTSPPVVKNAENLNKNTAPASAPASAPANAPATSPQAAPPGTQTATNNPAVVVDPNPARPAPMNSAGDLIPVGNGTASAAEIAAAENASAIEAANAEADNAANATNSPSTANTGTTSTGVPALW